MSQNPQQSQVDPRYLRAKDAARYLAIATSTLWKWSQTGIIPRPIRFGNRCTVWDIADLDSFIAAKKEKLA